MVTSKWNTFWVRIRVLALAPLLGCGLTASLQGESFAGWTNCVVVGNDSLELIVAPDVGRIMSMRRRDGENLLRVNAELAGTSADFGSGNWNNFGGEWAWPAAQSHWAAVQGADWPPSPLLDGRPWQTMLKQIEGYVVCTMRQRFGPPLNVDLIRRIKVPEQGTTFFITQTITAFASSSVPVCVWSITQIEDADAAVMPVSGARTNAIRRMGFDVPGTEALVFTDSAAILLPAHATMLKFCASSDRAWVAARRAGTVVIQQAMNSDCGLPFPDGGCPVEVFTSRDLGYTEIETLSREGLLTAGESHQNQLRISLLAAPSSRDPVVLAEYVQQFIGERH